MSVLIQPPSRRYDKLMSMSLWELATKLRHCTYHETQTSQVSQHTGNHSRYPCDGFEEQTSREPLIRGHHVVAIPEFLECSGTPIVRNWLVAEAVPGNSIVGSSGCTKPSADIKARAMRGPSSPSNFHQRRSNLVR
jgi:hypothetical protein